MGDYEISSVIDITFLLNLNEKKRENYLPFIPRVYMYVHIGKNKVKKKNF